HLAEDLAGAHAADGLAVGRERDLALQQQVDLGALDERDLALVLLEDLLAALDRRRLARGLEEFQRDGRIVGGALGDAGVGLLVHVPSSDSKMPRNRTREERP